MVLCPIPDGECHVTQAFSGPSGRFTNYNDLVSITSFPFGDVVITWSSAILFEENMQRKTKKHLFASTCVGTWKSFFCKFTFFILCYGSGLMYILCPNFIFEEVIYMTGLASFSHV